MGGLHNFSYHVLIVAGVVLSAALGCLGAEKDDLAAEERIIPLREVKSIYMPGGSDVDLDNYQSYIELPLRNAVRILIEKGIPTSWASANKHHFGLTSFFGDGETYSEIGLVWDGLSEANKAAVRTLLPESLEHHRMDKFYTEGDNHIMTDSIVAEVRANSKTGLRGVWKQVAFGQSDVHLYLPMKPDETVGELSDRWVKMTDRFQLQKRYRSVEPTDEEMMEALMRAGEKLGLSSPRDRCTLALLGEKSPESGKKNP